MVVRKRVTMKLFILQLGLVTEEKEKMKKNIMLIVAAIMFLLSGIDVRAEEETENVFSPEVYIANFLEADPEQKLYWENIKGEYYFLVPAAADLSKVTVYSGGANVIINDVPIEQGGECDLSATEMT